MKSWPRKECEEIYQCYPRKVAHLAALKAISKTLFMLKDEQLIGEPVQWLKQRVEAYARSVKGQEEKWIPHPATWFNDGRFDDLLPATTRAITENEAERRRLMDDLRGVDTEVGARLRAVAESRWRMSAPPDWHRDINWVRSIHYAWLEWRQGTLVLEDYARDGT